MGVAYLHFHGWGSTETLKYFLPHYIYRVISMENVITLPNVLRTLLAGFMVILMLRVNTPITEFLFGLTWKNSMIELSARIGYYLVLVTILYFILPGELFKPKETR